MSPFHPLVAAHERARWMRPDAHRFLRPDWRRYVQPGSELQALYDEIERKYRPDQPRVPAGVSEGGRWTADGGGAEGSPARSGNAPPGESDPRVLSDANPDDAKPGAQYAQNRRPGAAFERVVIDGRVVEPSPGQAARLAVVEAESRDVIRQVRDLDPNWKPAPSAYGTVEGLIAAYRSDTEQAQARLSELSRIGVGPGPYAGESIPTGQSVTTQDRSDLNRIGSQTGCHTCGTSDPGTKSGNFVADHQPPTALNLRNSSQRLYPQCIDCSLRQGGWVNQLKRGK